MYELLKTINDPADLRRLDRKALGLLAEGTARIRGRFRVADRRPPVLQPGHHRAHHRAAYVFNTPEDRIVWDVGHQTYPHKILTGRREAMSALAHAWGHIGLSRAAASAAYDTFGTAHSRALRSPPRSAWRWAQGSRVNTATHRRHRRRRDVGRHGLRGAEQRRRDGYRPAGDSQRQRHVDLAGGGRAQPVSRAAAVRTFLRGGKESQREGAGRHAAAVASGEEGRGACQRHGDALHAVRGVRLQLPRADRRP